MIAGAGADQVCGNLDKVRDVAPDRPDSCLGCVARGDRWVHLRVCQTCGYVGRCDSSKNRHATSHHSSSGHPLVRSYEPGESWWWCYDDAVGFEMDEAGPVRPG